MATSYSLALLCSTELVGIPEIICKATATSPVGTYDITIRNHSEGA